MGLGSGFGVGSRGSLALEGGASKSNVFLMHLPSISISVINRFRLRGEVG